MQHFLRLGLLLLTCALTIGCSSLCPPQGKRCKPKLEIKTPAISGPDTLNVGDATRYCLELGEAIGCGRCDNQGCESEMRFRWFLDIKKPDGTPRGDLKIVRGETGDCLDVEGKKAGTVSLVHQVTLNCGKDRPDCFETLQREFNRDITVQ